MKNTTSSDTTKTSQRRNLIIAIVGASVLILGSLSFVIGGSSRKTPATTKTVSSNADKTTAVDGTADLNDSAATTLARGGNGGGSKTDAERQAKQDEREAKRNQGEGKSESQRANRQNGSTSTTVEPIVEETTTSTSTSVPTTDSTELTPPSAPSTTDSSPGPTITYG